MWNSKILYVKTEGSYSKAKIRQILTHRYYFILSALKWETFRLVQVILNTYFNPWLVPYRGINDRNNLSLVILCISEMDTFHLSNITSSLLGAVFTQNSCCICNAEYNYINHWNQTHLLWHDIQSPWSCVSVTLIPNMSLQSPWS